MKVTKIPEKIVVATKNRGKLKEIAHILKKHLPQVELFGVWELGDFEMPKEIGKTYEENAKIKARFVAKRAKMYAIADDSGIEVSALNNKPGVISAVFAGENATDAENNNLLLSMLKGVPWWKRKATFVCVAVLAAPNGKIVAQTRGECKGFVLASPRGKGGFGYDPLFWVPKYKKTFAELEPGIKNSISHRAKAFGELAKVLKGLVK